MTQHQVAQSAEIPTARQWLLSSLLPAILLGLGLMSLWQWSDHQKLAQHRQQTIQITHDLKHYIIDRRHCAEEMAELDGFAEFLAKPNPDDPATPPEIQQTLDTAAKASQASLVALIGKDGRFRAVSDRPDRDRIMKINVSFRRYFQQARAGVPAMDLIIGAHSGNRLISFAAPVFDRHQPDRPLVGVLLYTLPARKLDQQLAGIDNPAMITVAPGVVVAGNQPRWLFRTTRPITQAMRRQLTAKSIFPSRFGEPLPFDVNQSTFQWNQRQWQRSSSEIFAGPKLNLLLLYPVADQYRWALIATTIVVACIAILTVTLSAGRLLLRHRQDTEWTQWQQTIFHPSPIPYMLLDENNRFIDANAAAAQLLGYADRQALVGLQPIDFSPTIQHTGEPSSSRAVKMIRTAREQGAHQFTWNHCRTDGSILPVRVVLIRTVYRNQPVLLAVLQDMTLQHNLERRSRRMQMILEQLPDSVLITDRQGRISMVNPALCRQSGYQPDELIGQNPSLFRSSRHNDRFYQHLWQTILAGQSWHGEMENRRKDGSLHWESVTITPLQDELGRIDGFIGLKQDISSQRQLLDALKQRGDILQTIAQSAQPLPATDNWLEHAKQILESIGLKMGADRVALFQLVQEPPFKSAMLVHQWQHPQCPDIHEQQRYRKFDFVQLSLMRWLDQLHANQPIMIDLRHAQNNEKLLLAARHTRNLLAIPILVQEQCWGLITFEHCTNAHLWAEIEINSLKMIATMLAAAIERKQNNNMKQQLFEQLQAVVDQVDQLLFVMRFEDNRILFANQTMKKLCRQNLTHFQWSQLGQIIQQQLFSDDTQQPGLLRQTLRYNPANRSWWQCREVAARWTDGVMVQLGIAENITRQHQAEQHRLKHETYLQSLINAIPVPIYHKNEAGVIQLANQAMAQLLSVPTDLMIHRHWQQVFPANWHKPLNNIEKPLLNADKPTNRAEIDLPIDGRHQRMLYHVEAYQPDAEQPAGMIGILMDVSEVIHSRDLAQRHAGDAQAESREKSMFLADLNHELRTPLNGILALAELLANSPMPDDQRQTADMIYHSANLLCRMIENILAFIHLEAGQFKLQPQPTDLNHLVQQTQTHLAPLATEYERELIVDTDDLNQPIMIDPDRLQRIMTNLLTHALKHAEPGPVKLNVATTPAPGRDQRCILNCRICYTATCQTQADGRHQPHRPTDQSMGLGITVSKRIIQAMGGQLQIQHQPDHLTTCDFQLNCPVAEQPPRLPTTPPQSVAFDISVLIAEDNRINRLVITRLCNELGCRVDTVHNGQQALHACQQRHYDLLLMDLRMPVLDGLQATEQIRNITEHPQPCIIALTAHTTEQDRNACMAAGMNDHLSKPVTRKALTEKLTQFFTPSDQTPKPTPTLPDIESADPQIFNPQVLIDAVGSDMSTIQQVIHASQQDIPRHLQAMEQADRQRDMAQLAKWAHALKGITATLGAPRMQHIVQQLEIGLQNDQFVPTDLLQRLEIEYRKLAKTLSTFLQQSDSTGS